MQLDCEVIVCRSYRKTNGCLDALTIMGCVKDHILFFMSKVMLKLDLYFTLTFMVFYPWSGCL